MDKNHLSHIKEQIEILRDELNVFIEYPDIFSSEIEEYSDKINKLINEYMISQMKYNFTNIYTHLTFL